MYIPAATGPTFTWAVAPGLMFPDASPSSGTEKVWTAVPVLLMLIVPPVTGNVIINGANENSVSVTSTLAAAEPPEPPDAPEADSVRNPKNARHKAIIETMTANQPSRDLSSFAMRPIVTVHRRTR